MKSNLYQSMSDSEKNLAVWAVNFRRTFQSKPRNVIDKVTVALVTISEVLDALERISILSPQPRVANKEFTELRQKLINQLELIDD